MAEFDDKLNSLLSNPEAMDQIMKIAQSLMGGGQTPDSGPSPTPGGASGQSVPLSGQTSADPWRTAPVNGYPPPQGWTPPAAASPGGQTGAAASGPDLSFLSGLGSIDPKTIAAFLPILRELSEARNSNARQLLFALRPYLKPERQDKVERALQLARLFHVGKKFLLKGDGHV